MKSLENRKKKLSRGGVSFCGKKHHDPCFMDLFFGILFR